MIWHPFVALGCVFIERIVQEENLLFKCWFRLPYSCMPGTVYVQWAKKRRRLSSDIFFTLSHQLNVRQSGAGTAAFSLFLPPQSVHAAGPFLLKRYLHSAPEMPDALRLITQGYP